MEEMVADKITENAKKIQKKMSYDDVMTPAKRTDADNGAKGDQG